MIGPNIDIPAPDIGTDGQTMARFMDTYSQLKVIRSWYLLHGIDAVGGYTDETESTGKGVAYCVNFAAKKLGMKLEKTPRSRFMVSVKLQFLLPTT